MVQLQQTPASPFRFSSKSSILRKVFVELKKLVRKDKNVRVLWEEGEGMEKNVHVRNPKSSTVFKIENGKSFSHIATAKPQTATMLCSVYKLWCG